MVPPSSSETVRWVREWRGPDGRCFRVGREGARLVADWEGFGMLRASQSGADVEVIPCAHLRPAEARKWRGGPVRALLRHLDGRPTLHGSAVAYDGRAFVFLGESGAGKSTCAAALCRRSRAELLADDLTEIEFVQGKPAVAPTDGEHWLFSDSAEALGHAPATVRKDLVPAARVSAGVCPLAAVIALTFSEVDVPVATPVRGEEAFATVNAGYARFIVDDASVHLRDLEHMATIVAAVPVLRFARPRSLAGLADTTSVLESLLARVLAGGS